MGATSRRCRDLRRLRGSTAEPSSSSTRMSAGHLRGELDGVLDEFLQDAAGGQAVQAGHDGSGRRLDVDALVAAGHLSSHVGDVCPLGQARLDRRLEPLDEPGEVARPATSRPSNSPRVSSGAVPPASVCAMPRTTVTGSGRRPKRETQSCSGWRPVPAGPPAPSSS